MKINSNIPIFIILTVFIASNTILYRYLNDGYFIDKKPTINEREVENVIFKLIAAHERVLIERNAEILRETERLRNRKLTITDSAELKAIEDKLKALELESQNVLEKVKNSENERKVAERKAQNNQLQLSELMESNSKMGAQLEYITEEFDEYVSTIEETLISGSFSEQDINSIKLAFRNKKGLDYLNDLVGNIQENRAALNTNFTNKLNNMSNEYHQGLKEIAKSFNDNNFSGILDDKGLLVTNESISSLKDSLNGYIASRNLASENKLNSALKSQEEKMLFELEKRIKTVREEESFKLSQELNKLLEKQEEIRLLDIEKIQKEADTKLALLEERLRNELSGKEKTIEVDIPKPDKPQYTSWVHIPSLWTSSSSTLTYTGKKVDSIAWSRNKIEDNQIISFNGKFADDGKCIIILYGNGRFKSWNDGIIITLSIIGSGRVQIDITKNGVDENSESIFTNSLLLEDNLNGYYYIQISEGKLTIEKSGQYLIKDFILTTELSGRIGFANREINNSKTFELTDIKLFNIR